MRPAIPYLMFPGTCEEALTFYAEVLDGEITRLVRVDDAPVQLPPDTDGQAIFDAQLSIGQLIIKASDDPAASVMHGSIALFLTLDDDAQLSALLGRLAEGGTVLFPPEGQFGMVEDRFGVRWMATIAS